MGQDWPPSCVGRMLLADSAVGCARSASGSTLRTLAHNLSQVRQCAVRPVPRARGSSLAIAQNLQLCAASAQSRAAACSCSSSSSSSSAHAAGRSPRVASASSSRAAPRACLRYLLIPVIQVSQILHDPCTCRRHSHSAASPACRHAPMVSPELAAIFRKVDKGADLWTTFVAHNKPPASLAGRRWMSFRYRRWCRMMLSLSPHPPGSRMRSCSRLSPLSS